MVVIGNNSSPKSMRKIRNQWHEDKVSVRKEGNRHAKAINVAKAEGVSTKSSKKIQPKCPGGI